MQRISDIPLQLDELRQAELAREFQTGEVPTALPEHLFHVKFIKHICHSSRAVEGFLRSRSRRHLPAGQSRNEQVGNLGQQNIL